MNEQQFEDYLHEFCPKTLRTLPAPARVSMKWRRLAAAAVIVLACGASLWFVVRKQPALHRAERREANAIGLRTPLIQRMPVLMLERVALENPEQLDMILQRASRGSLPSFTSPDSTLRVLAKE